MYECVEAYRRMYRAQRLRFFRRKMEEIRENLLDDPWGFNFDAEILLLKNANIEDVDLINIALEEICG